MRRLPGALLLLCCLNGNAQGKVDLSRSRIAVGHGFPQPQRALLARLLREEVLQRTGLTWDTAAPRRDAGALLLVAHASEPSVLGYATPSPSAGGEVAEAFLVRTERRDGRDVVWLVGNDLRGAIYAIGRLLSYLEWGPGRAMLDASFSADERPHQRLRGHQVGYRNTANSWDAWTPRQMEQYIRELALTGSNAIENIPFSEKEGSPHFKVSPDSMHRHMSRVCQDYGLDFWVWTPGNVDLSDSTVFRSELERHAALYRRTPKLDAVFFPGGDPGSNHPRHVMPFLKALSAELALQHPKAGVWVSLQGFSDEETDYFFNYLADNGNPDWLAGVVTGPGSPSLSATRHRLPPRYRHRHYADITHNVRCELPVPDWDQAFALTLGREAPNPRPVFFARTHAKWAPFTDGFITYSDGVHDDVNKFIWNRRGWDPEASVETLLEEYTRLYFGEDASRQAAAGILALERNWSGPVEENGTIPLTLVHWQMLERSHPRLSQNWRWQLLTLRAAYDAWQKGRKAYEAGLEKAAMGILRRARELGAEKAMAAAIAKVGEAVTRPYDTIGRNGIRDRCAALFESIGLQTSVDRFRASGAERGAILDLLEHPLNNRWWMEDEFKRIGTMKGEEEKLERLQVIATWEDPGKGSYYDDISNVSASPRVKTRVEDATDFLWENNGRSRRRLSTQTYQNFPELEYADLDPKGRYVIRVAGYGDALLRVDGERIEPTLYDKSMEGFKEFPLSPVYHSDGRIRVRFDQPEESHLNWRQHSKVSDIWLIRTDR